MEQRKDSTQTRKGRYLNWNERILIEGFLKAGMSESNIVKELEKDRRRIRADFYESIARVPINQRPYQMRTPPC